MGDRRVGDRREKEKGVIKIKIKDSVGYIILGAMFLISLIMNLILVSQNTSYINELADCYDYISELQYNETFEDTDEDNQNNEDSSVTYDEENILSSEEDNDVNNTENSFIYAVDDEDSDD